MIYSKNMRGMSLLNHNRVDVRTREEVDEVHRIVCGPGRAMAPQKDSKPHLQHGTYSFLFWDGDGNC
jgi:hypothetical protein